MKTTTQRKILFEILSDYTQGLTLGHLRVKFYQKHTPQINYKFSYEMKRNSRMSAWLNQLCRGGEIYINRCGDQSDWLYSLK